MMGKVSSLLGKCFPAKLVGLYVLVGAWNTFFGTLAYFFFVWAFEGCARYDYMIAAVVSTIVSVTESFLTYKLIVFRTKGNWMSEYFKCWTVYGGAGLINFLLLPVCVEFMRWLLCDDWKRFAPYVGGLLLTGVTVFISFIGHKNLTFRKQEVAR